MGFGGAKNTPGAQPNYTSVPAGPNAGDYAQPGKPATTNQPVATSAPTPGQTAAPIGDPNAFLPQAFSAPYTGAIQQGMNLANWGAQAIPQAAGFQNALFSPGMTPLEQQFLGASGDLGLRGLAQTQANLMGQFENQGANSGIAPAMLQAANQFGAQMNQQAGQMGVQRQGLAAQALPFTMGFPLQALQSAQQGSEGLYGMAQSAMTGGLQFPLAMHGSNPFNSPTIMPNSSGGGKLGK